MTHKSPKGDFGELIPNSLKGSSESAIYDILFI